MTDSQNPAPANGAADPYAMCKSTLNREPSDIRLIGVLDGGYQAYLALWYQALAQQSGAGQPAGEMPKPPGA